ncbi:MAG: SMI1/KNR4 family protein [Eubacterium sp.]
MSTIIECIGKLKNLSYLEPVSMTQINDAESNLGLTFSEEYKAYIGKYGCISAKGIELTGICPSKRLNVIDVTNNERKIDTEFPKDMYVIENIAIDGILLLQNKQGEVFEKCIGEKPVKKYGSIAEYIKNEIIE